MTPWTTRNGYRGPVRRWVGASGSLSARLAATGQTFSVQVLSQGRQKLRWDESRALGLERAGAGYVREVLLRVDGDAVVLARSVTPHTASLGAWRSVRGLGTRPLADVLFGRSGIARAPLEFAQIRPSAPARRHLAKAWRLATGDDLVQPRTFPARRSVFQRRGAPLLVMETFPAQTQPWCWRSGDKNTVRR